MDLPQQNTPNLPTIKRETKLKKGAAAKEQVKEPKLPPAGELKSTNLPNPFSNLAQLFEE